MDSFSRRQALKIGTGAAIGVAVGPVLVRPAIGAIGSPTASESRVRLEFGPDRDDQGLFRSREVAVPDSFELVGLSWDGVEPLPAQMRVREDGNWGRWVPLPSIGDHLPDHAEPPRATAPTWFGRSRRLQVRVARVAGGMHAELIHPGEFRPVALEVARALPGAPRFVPRSRWDAQKPRERPVHGRVKIAFVHHTVNSNRYTRKDSASLVRSIQQYHRNVLRWNDIGYNALIDRFGRIFEGRAGGMDRAVVGAQSEGFNENSAGVALIGDFTSVSPSEEAIRALGNYLAWKLDVHGVPALGKATVESAGGSTNRFERGEKVRLSRISGHRKGNFTSCPGNKLNRLLPDVRKRVDRLQG